MAGDVTLKPMVEAITYKAAVRRFGCGNSYENLMVVNFSGPGGAEASAYCCNVNMDMDAEPQAYGPLGVPGIKPIDNLWDGGWLDTAQNEARKKLYEAAQKKLDDLEKQKADLAAAAKQPGGPSPAPAKPPGVPPGSPSPAAAKPPGAPSGGLSLDQQIKNAKDDLAKFYWKEKEEDRPVNFGKIFWKWYGPAALTPKEKNDAFFFEKIVKKEGEKPVSVKRTPTLDDKKPELEDVNGRFPVIQQDYEPGQGYYVSGFPRRINLAFPEWDQRAFLLPGTTSQIPNAALSEPLEKATSLHLRDIALGMRLDTDDSLTFTFLDRGKEGKVGECSVRVFQGLGGAVADVPNRSQNDWLVLYLAFARSAGRTAGEMLDRFATAANADEFPVILAFIAQATVDAKNSGKVDKKNHDAKIVSADPLQNFERWKTSQGTNTPIPLPGTFAAIDRALNKAGFSPFAARIAARHAGSIG